ncbi:hypothetical protein [Tardiphaga robiniae]|uniref:Uncharacterized protein n=1 Tax=Tardiphaga robiniae TaxID=943830 RepID=A0A7G6TX84_9BRAD|nr:hypothetical protein [Tardiphaga robiniae]QND71366.1 hypothetical protein HB776_09030 [Tardiphaga robiniae]
MAANASGPNVAPDPHSRLSRVAKDVLVSVILTFALSSVLWGFLGAFHGPLLWLLLPFGRIIPLLIFGIPASIFVYGLVKLRLGFVLGPLLLAGVVVTATHVSVTAALTAVNAYATPGLDPPSRPHVVLGFEGSADCDVACVRILATSTHTLAFRRDATKEWRLYRRGSGDECETADRWPSKLEFLRAGFLNSCATDSPIPELSDALIIRERVTSGRLTVLPRLFHGVIHEISERMDGRERLLGRMVSGTIRFPVPDAVAIFAFGVERSISAGQAINTKTFLSAATGIPEAELYAFHAFPPATIMDDLERFFDRPQVSNLAIGAWARIALANSKDHADVMKPRIDRLLASGSANRIAAGLAALFGFPEMDRHFARDRIIELAFNPLVDAPEALLLSSLKGHLVQIDDFSDVIRQRARAFFVGEPALGRGRVELLFMIMVRGGDAMRRNAVDTLFELQGSRFEDAVFAIGYGGSDVWARSMPTRWTVSDVQRLMGRMADVPNERLSVYVGAFRPSGISAEQKRALVDHVRERLRIAEASAARRDTEITSLRQLVETVQNTNAS